MLPDGVLYAADEEHRALIAGDLEELANRCKDRGYHDAERHVREARRLLVGPFHTFFVHSAGHIFGAPGHEQVNGSRCEKCGAPYLSRLDRACL